jgi:hypothetical protein
VVGSNDKRDDRMEMVFVSLGRLNNEVQAVLKRAVLFGRAGEAIKIYFLETQRAEKNYLNRTIRHWHRHIAGVPL